jgi:hypothetical protein
MILERRYELDQCLIEVRDRVTRKVFEHTEVDEHHDCGIARPDVRSPQDARIEDAKRWLRLFGRGRSS